MINHSLQQNLAYLMCRRNDTGKNNLENTLTIRMIPSAAANRIMQGIIYPTATANYHRPSQREQPPLPPKCLEGSSSSPPLV